MYKIPRRESQEDRIVGIVRRWPPGFIPSRTRHKREYDADEGEVEDGRG